jgi:rhodanese-related sulfurtransferase
MNKLIKSVVALFATLGIMMGVTACAPAEPVDMTTITAVIDVRTPAEYAEGHLEGAVLMDVQGSDFAVKVATLDPAGNYVVYCRSGNRSAAAIDQMKSLGFTNLTDGGAVATAASLTGLPVVQ